MKKHNLKKTIVFSLLFFMLLFAGSYGVAHHYFNKFTFKRTVIEENIVAIDPNDEQSSDGKTNDKADKEINLLLLGTDKSGYRTDSMMIVHYDPHTNTTSMFSIPRDYRIDLSENVQELIRNHSPHIKLTELHAYAKMADYESPASLTAQAIEELLDISFDHLIMININAFKEVVDSVGGVEVYVPQAMNYDDPTQNLHINLQEGLQLLDGDKAEQLVRFRKGNNNSGYGDFGRMEMQQYFLSAYLKKVFTLDTAFNITEVFNSLSEFVQTDATLNDVLALMQTTKHIDFDKVYSHTLPGKDNRIDGIYYYDPPSVSELKAFYSTSLTADQFPQQDSLEYSLRILNGNGSSGLADEYQALFEKLGYAVDETGDFNGTRTIKTQIIVPELGLGQDLKSHFKLSEVIVDPNRLGSKNEIMIILGKLEI